MSFSADKAKQKLSQVNNTQQSIQSTSQWCLFHYRHANEIVTLWKDAFINPDQSIDQSESNYRLALFYLCNDIVQFAKKKEEKYAPVLHEFSKVMPQILKFIARDTMSTHLKPKYMRVLDVWRDRFVYSSETINKLQADLNTLETTTVPIQDKSTTKSVDLTSIHQPVANNYQQSNFGPGIPPELTNCVDKYNKLNELYKSYKKNLTNFNKVANSILTDTSGLTGEKETQLNNLLSSLSTLGNVGLAGINSRNSSTPNTDDSTDLTKFDQTEALGSQISAQFKEVSELRADIVSELRKIAQELDDWMMLDKSKQTQIEGTLNKIKDKKNSIIQENEKVSVFNYDENDEDIIPKYDNDVDSDSDEDKLKDSDDSDNEGRDNSKRDILQDADFNDEQFVDYNATANDISDESENNKGSSLKKRLLEEDQDLNDNKRVKKNVKFSEVNETLVFGDNEQQYHDESEIADPTEDTSSGTSNVNDETTQNGDSDLTALLGLLQ